MRPSITSNVYFDGDDYDFKFRRGGVTYYVVLYLGKSDRGEVYSGIGQWWDDSDNGLGYNNRGYIGIDRERYTPYYTVMEINRDNLQDYVVINSEFNRELPMSVKRLMIDKMKNYIDYDAINSDYRIRRESYRRKRTMRESNGDKYLVKIYYRKNDEYPEELKYARTEDEVYDICVPYTCRGFYCTYEDENGNEYVVDSSFACRESYRRRNKRRMKESNFAQVGDVYVPLEDNLLIIKYEAVREYEPEATEIIKELQDYALGLGCTTRYDGRILTIETDTYGYKEIDKALLCLKHEYDQPMAVRLVSKEHQDW